MVIVFSDMKEKPNMCGDCQYCVLTYRDYFCTLTGVIEKGNEMDSSCPLIELDIATEVMLKEFTSMD